MFRILKLAVIVSLFGVSPALATHYRVYFLGGQSNASGRGDASQLTEPLASSQPDVRFYCHHTLAVTNLVWLLEDQWIDLAPGSGHGTQSPVYAKEFGAEVSFGRSLADSNPAVHIAIVKYTHGGTSLYSDWAPNGVRYNTFVATAQAALAALTSAGDTYELGGMIWQQGEADAGSVANANAYNTNLTSLIARVRQDVFGGRSLPFIIGSLSTSQSASITTPGTGWYIVRQAQESVATNVVQVGFVNTDGYPTRPNNAIHFAAAGQVALGQGFAAEILRLEALDANSTNSTPVFKVTAFQLVGSLVHFEWSSQPGKFYRVERSPNLIDWTKLSTNYPAAMNGSLTGWTEPSATPAGNGILAQYNMQTGLNGNFNTTAFDSVDAEPNTTATRLVQGGSLTGGGAASFVLSNALFNSSASGSPGLNLAGGTTASQAAAAAAGNFFSFTHQSGGIPVTYQSLTFYADQFGVSAKVDVSYITNATETFVLQGFIPTISNASVTQKTINFQGFTTTQDVTWRFYLYGAAGTYGTRFDDITLYGVTTATPTNSNLYFYRVRLLSP